MSGPPQARVAALDAALALEPGEPRLHFHRALALWRSGRSAEVAGELDRVVQHEPGRPGLALLRGLAALAVKQPVPETPATEEEAATLAAVHALLAGGVPKPDAPEPWRMLSRLAAGKQTEPERLAEIAARSGRTVASILRYYEGVARLRVGDAEGARKAWQTARDAGYTGAWLVENLAKLDRVVAIELAEAGRWSEVAALAPSTGSTADRILDETIATALHHLGLEAARKGQWADAARHWRRANELHGTRALAQNLALAEEALGRWDKAAEAWRQMIRRRPRKADHPDALTDGQVAALWMHMADCYVMAKELWTENDAADCIEKALEYAGDDMTLRLEAAKKLAGLGREGVATMQLRIVTQNQPENADALEGLGQMLADYRPDEAVKIFTKLLEVEPGRPGAKESLANAYLGAIDRTRFFAPANAVKVAEEGLAVLPDHPLLLVALGRLRSEAGAETRAAELFRRAIEVAPERVSTTGYAFHELLHFSSEQGAAETAFEVLRANEKVGPEFWLDQAEDARACEIDASWMGRILDQAVATSGPGGDQTKAGTILSALRILNRIAQYRPVFDRFLERARTEVPGTGAKEFAEAIRCIEQGDTRRAKSLLEEARRVARQNNDRSVDLEIDKLGGADDEDFDLDGLPFPPHILLELVRRFPNGPPSDPRKIPKDLLNEILKYLR